MSSDVILSQLGLDQLSHAVTEFADKGALTRSGKPNAKFAGYHVSIAQCSAWVSYWLLCFQQVHVVGVCVSVARKREGSLVLW